MRFIDKLLRKGKIMVRQKKTILTLESLHSLAKHIFKSFPPNILRRILNELKIPFF